MFWVDITNLPHVNFFERFIKSHPCLVTTRNMPGLHQLLRKKGIEFKSAGRHGRDLKEKLIASAERIIALAEMLEGREIEACITKHSVEAPRVAFGLGIPAVGFVDNEYAEAQNRLTLPLLTKIIVPWVTDEKKLIEQGASANKITKIKSILEYAQIKNFKAGEKPPYANYVVVRPSPIWASYHRKRDITQEIIDRLRNMDYKVVVLPRGEEEYQGAINLRGVDALSLIYHAEAVISGGGTMNREAALLGVPAISFYREELLGVDRFLIDRGLMRHATKAEEVAELMPEKEERAEIRAKAQELLQELEDPIEKLEDILNDIGAQS